MGATTHGCAPVRGHGSRGARAWQLRCASGAGQALGGKEGRKRKRVREE